MTSVILTVADLWTWHESIICVYSKGLCSRFLYLIHPALGAKILLHSPPKSLQLEMAAKDLAYRVSGLSQAQVEVEDLTFRGCIKSRSKSEHVLYIAA